MPAPPADPSCHVTVSTRISASALTAHSSFLGRLGHETSRNVFNAFVLVLSSPVLESVVLTLGGVVVPVTFAGPQGQFPSLDQINAGALPRSLQGCGVVDAILTVSGKTSNRVELRFR